MVHTSQGRQTVEAASAGASRQRSAHARLAADGRDSTKRYQRTPLAQDRLPRSRLERVPAFALAAG